MASLLGMLGASGNALDIFQQALAVIQNNVNNSSTPGYASQSLNLESQPLDVAGGLTGGLASAGLDNSRDPFAEEQVEQQTQTLGQYTAQAQATGTIQSFFDATGDSGVSAALSSFLQSFSTWSTTPTDASAQQAVISTAGDVASSVRGLANSLSQSAQQIDTDISSTAGQINTIASQIQSYNVLRMSETTPDPSQDAQLYSSLDSLSQLTNFTTVTQTNGSVTVLLGGGSPLVIGNQQYSIGTTSSANGAQVLDSNGDDITSQVTSGQLGGLLDVRNNVLGSMLGTSTATGTLNQFASTLANTVNGILESGNVSTSQGAAAGTALFTLSATPNDAAATLAVNPAITVSQLAPVDSSGNSNGNANQLAALENTPLAQLGGVTLTQYFGQIATAVGDANQTATNNQTSQKQVVASATSLVNQVSGVSLDAAATSVLEFQRAYQASAQVLTILNTLADTVINMIQPYS